MFNQTGGIQMKQRKKNLLAVAGVISTIIGIVVAIPAFLKGNYLAGIFATVLIVGGIILLAISFGD